MTLSIPKFEAVSVLVCGDVMLDRYYYGDTTRISPEAPVPVVRIKNSEIRPGGAANVALNTVALGASTILIGAVGKDTMAEELKAIFDTVGIQHCLLDTDKGTITKLRVLSQNQQLIRLDFEEDIPALEPDRIYDIYAEKLKYADAVILSDYAKGVLTRPADLIQAARQLNKPVLIDPKTYDFEVYAHATVVTPNLKEFEQVVGHCPNRQILIERAFNLLQKYSIEALLITEGKNGMTLIRVDHEPVHIPAHTHDVYDVTGAGDTVIATMAASLAAGAEIEQAAFLANVAAGISVTKLGAATVSTQELKEALVVNRPVPSGVLTEAALIQAVAEAKMRGETLVMTNGCFDLLHAGHIQYLKQAKSLGDRLIIAVNDDESVRKLKGPERPLNTLEERMAVLAALSMVDMVVSFSEETPERLISRVLPHYLVKGGDYQPHQIAGSQAVIENGGEVIVLGFKEGCSTTGLIERIREVET